MENLEIKKQEEEKKRAQEKRFKANLEYLRERKLEILAMFGEMSFGHLSDTQTEISKEALDTLTCNVNIVRNIILNA